MNKNQLESSEINPLIIKKLKDYQPDVSELAIKATGVSP
jgi:hypothetical protein